MTARGFSEIMKEEANKLAGKTKAGAPVLSTEDQELNNWKTEGRNRERRKTGHRERK